MGTKRSSTSERTIPIELKLAVSGRAVNEYIIANALIIPRETSVDGVVDASHQRGHFKGASVLELRLTSLTLNGTRYPISTGDLISHQEGKGQTLCGHHRRRQWPGHAHWRNRQRWHGPSHQRPFRSRAPAPPWPDSRATPTSTLQRSRWSASGWLRTLSSSHRSYLWNHRTSPITDEKARCLRMRTTGSSCC